MAGILMHPVHIYRSQGRTMLTHVPAFYKKRTYGGQVVLKKLNRLSRVRTRFQGRAGSLLFSHRGLSAYPGRDKAWLRLKWQNVLSVTAS